MSATPQEVQEQILDILESEKKADLIKSSKMKQGRLIIALKNKYNFEKQSLGLN